MLLNLPNLKKDMFYFISGNMSRSAEEACSPFYFDSEAAASSSSSYLISDQVEDCPFHGRFEEVKLIERNGGKKKYCICKGF